MINNRNTIKTQESVRHENITSKMHILLHLKEAKRTDR